MRKIKINFKFNKHFFIRAFMIVILLILVSMTIKIVLQNKPTKGAQTPVLPVASTENQSKTGTGTTSQSVNKLQDIGQMNPFIDLTVLKQRGQVADQNQISSNVNGGLPVLPAIPSGQPRPDIGSIPIPTAPVSNVQNGLPRSLPPTAASPKIQGVLIGQRGGKNQAVMSDGTVVSEGDHYQDGRIAYIGGSGITFDNGREIKY